MHPALLDGHPKATIIESFLGEVMVIRPGFKISFQTLREAQRFIFKQGWEVNVEIIKGSAISRGMRK
jgi:hypothetical protein